MWKDILQNIARQSARRGTLPEPTPRLLREVWPALVSESLARLSEPASLQDRTLYVKVRNRELAREWRHSPVPLLRRVRRFSPWPIETLDIEHAPDAGLRDLDADETSVVDKSDAPAASQAIRNATDGFDEELRSLIESIDQHRRDDER